MVYARSLTRLYVVCMVYALIAIVEYFAAIVIYIVAIVEYTAAIVKYIVAIVEYTAAIVKYIAANAFAHASISFDRNRIDTERFSIGSGRTTFRQIGYTTLLSKQSSPPLR